MLQTETITCYQQGIRMTYETIVKEKGKSKGMIIN